MTTRNIAPREDGEGSIGTSIKRWLKGFFNDLDVSGDLEIGGEVSAESNVSVSGNLSVRGTATGVTPEPSDNSTKLATTEFVKGYQRADGWSDNTAYSTGNIVRVSTLPTQYVLTCTSSGTSGVDEPNCTGASVGDEIFDGSVTWTVSAYLLVTGGTVVYNITFANDALIKNANDNGRIAILGGNENSRGATFSVNGKSRSTNPGAFELTANNGVSSNTLIGKPDGTLLWGNKTVVTDTNAYSRALAVMGAAKTFHGFKQLLYLSLPAGTWVVTGHIAFTDTKDGLCYGGIIDTNTSSINFYLRDSAVMFTNRVSGSPLMGQPIGIQTTRILDLTKTTKVYLCAWADGPNNSTSNAARMEAVRIPIKL